MKNDKNQDFSIDMEPPSSTHQANLRVLKTKTGQMFVGKMKNNKVSAWQKEFGLKIAKYKPFEPISEACIINIRLNYSPPKYLLPKFNKCKTIVKDTRPDCDNVVKVILDELTNQKFWVDDSLIWQLNVEKCWEIHPSIKIKITQNDNDCL
jgi:Holliday junction resolvase RusA-like endonuclease